MTPAVAIGLAVLLAAFPAAAARLPVPPIPPRIAPSDLPAPMPDQDMFAPPALSGPAGPQVRPHLFNPDQHAIGDGFAPYSTVQNERDQRLQPTPGFLLSVPLH